MTLAELVARYRVAAHDIEVPGFCSDEEICDYLNEAQDEAAIRGRMLRVTAETNPGLCAIAVTAGVAHYALDPRLYELSYLAWRATGDPVRSPLALRTREWMDRNVMYWRDMPAGEPCYLVNDGLSVQLVPAPGSDGELLIEGYSTPAAPMVADADEPGIPSVHHIHLIQWALHRAFSKPDAEFFDPNRSALAEAEFSRYFGARPDVDLRSDTREDEPQHIVAWL